MRILFSSQDFWYWPTTQMFSIIQHLLLRWFKWEIWVLKNKSTEIFYKNFVTENPNWNVILQDNVQDNYDFYVWIYDPNIIFYARKKNKKNIFLCNLSFLWNDKLINKYNGKEINVSDIGLVENHHELVLLWYMFADQVFIRSSDKLDTNSILYNKIKDKVRYIWPIIYPKRVEKWLESHVLIQLWWQVNPITPKSFYCNYFKIVKKILDTIEWKKILCVNPLLENISKEYFAGIEILSTLPQYKYQQYLSQSSMLLAPFWINTYFESVYFNIPTYILPEQHLWHIKSLLHYFSVDTLKKYWTLLYTQEAPYNLEWSNESEFIEFLSAEYSRILEKDSLKICDSSGIWNIMIDNNYDSLVNKDIDYFLNAFL